MRRLTLAAERRAQRVPRWLAAAAPWAPPVLREPVVFASRAGYQISACVHRPAGGSGRARPGVLLCPGIDDPGAVFDGEGAPVSADEVARLGVVCMHFDPAGRGGSWGAEDYGGPEHQDDVLTALRYLLARPDVVPSRSGVVAISYGVAMAVGALAQAEEDGRVGWLIDWEGPCDREIITAGGRLMFASGGHGLGDETWWPPREAVRHVGRLRCGYFRYQAAEDHAQPGELRHAWRMVRAAAQADLPWFQLNDHPRGVLPEQPDWYPRGHGAANGILLRKIAEFSAL